MRRYSVHNLLLMCHCLIIGQCSGLTVRLRGSGTSVELGQTFRFTCTVTNDDNPTSGTVSFGRVGGAPVSSFTTSCSGGASDPGYSHSCGSSGVYHLDISSVGVSDNAAWRCTRINQNSNTITLPVYYGPGQVTLDKSSPQTVTKSSTLTVVCFTSCNPCSYTWKKGTTNVSTTRTLSLTNINRNQTGDYICTATNTQTETSASSSILTVIVQYPPEVILDTPSGSSNCRPYRVYVGQQNVQLTCQVTSTNPDVAISFSWTHNGSPIPSVTSSVYSLSPVSRSSGGRYTCAGRNSAGTSSNPPSLQVDVLDAPTISLPSSKTVMEGQTLKVTCSVTYNDSLAIEWTRKDGKIFTPQTGPTLIINTIQRSQTGTYVCTANITLSSCSAAYLSPAIKDVAVVVQYKPRISGIESSYPVTESSALQINCSRYTTPGNPSTTIYRWTGPGSYTSNGTVLSISSISRTQTGQYTCTATNTLTPTGGPPQQGTATGQFHVDVQYIPPIPTDLLAWSTDSTSVSMSWRTVLHEGLSYQFVVQYKEDGGQWTEMDKRFTEDGEIHVQAIINGLKPETLYFVRVKSENTFGSSRFTLETRVLTKDSTPADASEISSGLSIVMLGVGIFLFVFGIAICVVACLYVKRKGFMSEKRKTEYYASMGGKEGNTYDELNIREGHNYDENGQGSAREITTPI